MRHRTSGCAHSPSLGARTIGARAIGARAIGARAIGVHTSSVHTGGGRVLSVVAVVAGLLAGARTVAAQNVPNRDAAIEVRRQFLADLDTLESKFLALADAIPAEKYAWRPAPGVRSVGEVFMHVASEFYVYTPLAYGATPSPVVGHGREAFQKFEAMSTKPDVLRHLREGFAYAKQTVGALEPGAITGKRKLFGTDATIVESSFAMVDDLHEHLGQLIAYARMNGVKPPWSK